MIELGSVNLVVKDITAAERFYVDVLGLTVDAGRSNRPSFLLLRAANCMVILQQAGADPHGGIELGFAVEDVNAIKLKLGDRAVVQQMGWGNAVETTDPEGTRLNLYRLHPTE
jgi:catechol 2,3-dioxygenase-like lactoylglutathione lyase family enzyme